MIGSRVLQFASLWLPVALAAACGGDRLSTPPPGEAPPGDALPGEALPGDAAATRSAGRALYGAVVTSRGGPVSGAEVAVAGKVVSRTNAAGEFSCWLGEGGPHDFVVRASFFEDFRSSVSAAPEGTELLIELGDPGPTPSEETGVLYLTRAGHRGAAGVRVRFLHAVTQEVLHETRTLGDGAALWPFRLSLQTVLVEVSDPAFRVEPPRRTVLVDHGVLPWAPPKRRKVDVKIDALGLVGEPGRLSICNASGGQRFHWTLPADTVAGCRSGVGAREWALAVTDQTVCLESYVVGEDGARVRLPKASAWRVQCRDGTELVDLLVDPWPTSVVFGPSMRDALEWRMDETPRGRIGGTSPWIDLPPHIVSFQSIDTQRDRRLVSTLASPGAAPAAGAGVTGELIAFEGTGGVELRMRYEVTPKVPVWVGIARRGSRFVGRVPLDNRETVRFEGLCAGAFLLWFEREQESRDGIRGYEGIRMFVVGPGETTRVSVDWERNAGLGAVRRVR